MKEKIQLGKLVPRYSVPWLLGALAWQLGLYFLAKLLTDGRFHYDLSIPLDGRIPFVPAFMLIYWGAYLSWGLNYILAARESREHCRRCITADMIAKALCFVIFLLLPTTIASVRAAAGCKTPFDILPAVWLSSVLSVTAGLKAAWLLSLAGRRRQ